MLAPLLCPKEGNLENPFEIKIDNYCFAGFPLRIENSAHSLAVGFVLPGSAASHIVESFQKLSKKIAIAIDSEQRRIGYLKSQLMIMQKAHDEIESNFSNVDEPAASSSPYSVILGNCYLFLKNIFRFKKNPVWPNI